jgi:hypothetical protein
MVRSGIRLSSLILALIFATLGGTAGRIESQTAGSAGLISIRLEKKDGKITKTVAQNTVFRNGDILRFRLTSRIAGYLYVLDKGTTGITATLFPIFGGAAASNSIAANESMVVPATGDGWFEVSGPAGFDIVYILVSATPIELPPAQAEPGTKNAQPPASAPLPPNLEPRCDDEVFKARGDCIDPTAGVAPLPPNAPVPRELEPLARNAARDIILTDDGDGTAVKPAPSAKLPLIYTFRLAHLE